MSDRSGWDVTTHEWARDLDRAHLQAVRARLGAGVAAGGRRHAILEVVAYADDEAASRGRVGRVQVTCHTDGSVTVDDDGRGTDTRRDAAGRVIRKPVMATPDVRFADEAAAPLLPDGLPRRGMSTVAALSRVLTHENHRADGSWSQTYRFGVPDADLTAIPPRGHSGTRVRFRADLDGPADLTPADLAGFDHVQIHLGR